MLRPAKILFSANHAGYFLTHRLPVARAAMQSGFEVHVAAPADPAVSAIETEGFSFHAVPMTRWGRNPWQEARTLWSLLRLYRWLKPDLIHHVTIKPILYGGVAARLAGAPAVVNSITGLGSVFVADGLKAKVFRFAVRRAYRATLGHTCNRAIFQNPDDFEAFVDQGIVAREACSLIRGSGVDTRRFVPTPELDGRPLVMLPSRLLWEKGVGEFVEAARRLRRARTHARFALVGDIEPGNPATVPRERLERWRKEGLVELWGHREDMPAVLAQAHVVCLPSYREGVPKVLIEAAACARPIVACDVPGCREIARDGDNGLLVPVRDPAALANAIQTLVEDPSRRRHMGARGRDLAVAEFSVEHVVEQTLAVYHTLLQRAGAHSAPARRESHVRWTPGPS